MSLSLNPPLTDDPNAIAAASHAARPAEFTVRSWLRVAARVAGAFGRENLTLVAAGCAFYALLAMAPSLAALAALYGFIADPADIQRHLAMLEEIAPPAAYEVIETQAAALNAVAPSRLGWASIGAALFAVWSARAGVRALMSGVSYAYRERDSRPFIEEHLTTFLLTLFLVVTGVVTLALVVVTPAVLAVAPLGGLAETIASLVRWPIALAAVLASLTVVYHFAPPRRGAKWRWLTPGAVLAVALWLIGSAAFTLYLARFGDYNATYGALGAVAALLMWFWLSALAALTGAALNAELELETTADTTAGPERPVGERDAVVADNVVAG